MQAEPWQPEGADTTATLIATGIGQSAFVNNYLDHEEARAGAEAEMALGACLEEASACNQEHIEELALRIHQLDTLDAERDAALIAACGGGLAGNLSADCGREYAKYDAARRDLYQGWLELSATDPLNDYFKAEYFSAPTVEIDSILREAVLNTVVGGTTAVTPIAIVETALAANECGQGMTLSSCAAILTEAGLGIVAVGAGKIVAVVGGEVITVLKKTDGSFSAGGVAKRIIDPDTVSFGRNANQQHHTWRHIDEIGMDRTRVQNSVLDDIPADLPSGPHRRRITVDGVELEYRIFKFDDGTFNVGTIFDL